MDRRRVWAFYGIPAVWKRILEADRTGYDLSSLREANTGTSAITPEFLGALRDAFPAATTSVGYGSTEAGGACMLLPEDVLRKPTSIGLPYPGGELRIDRAGELCVRSPYLFKEYYNDAAATSAAMFEGWYHTGDLAEQDDDGFYYIVGRASDIIRTGGESVAPVEVDLVVQQHPAIQDAAVAGIPHDDWGEMIAAFVVLKPDRTLELSELRDHCRAQLAAYKHPRQLIFVDAIPRTGATGQVQRPRLIEIALAQR
jgi:acyl-CoA synthetase (AMP-forming)/AMP-acid ligase II